MAKNSIRDYSTSAASNTDIGGIGTQGTNLVSNFDNAFRELMSQLADMNAGTSPIDDTFSLCDPADATKKFRIDVGAISTATTRTLIMPNSDVTISVYGATLTDDADATTARTTLGLGTSATVNTGTSGATIPLLNGNNTHSGSNTFTSTISMTGANNGIEIGAVGSSNTPFIDFHSSASSTDFDVRVIASGGTAGTGGGTLEFTCTSLTKGGNTIWHAGNDGSGSGLDADLLDGMNATSAATANTIVSRNSNGDSLFNAIALSTIEHTSNLIITYNGTENFRLNSDAILSNGLTVTKNAITDIGTGLSLQQAGIIWASRDGAASTFLNRDTNDGIVAQFGRSKTAVGSISVTTTATAYNTSSDGRAKINRAPLYNSGIVIDALSPITYEWSHVRGATGVGFIAQDLQSIVPEAVTAGDDNASLKPGDEGFEWWSVDMSKLVPYLVAEVKSLRSRIAALEAV